MKHRAPGPADRRVSPSSPDDLDSADVADTLVANDVDTRVGAGQSSSEDPHKSKKHTFAHPAYPDAVSTGFGQLYGPSRVNNTPRRGF